MRRLLSILVLSATGLGPVAPLALAATDANTPACCRRDGKHRCAGMSDMAGMPGMSGTGSGEGLPTLRATAACPHRSPSSIPAQTAQAPEQDFAALQPPVASLVLVSDLIGFATQPLRRNSERGPPTSR